MFLLRWYTIITEATKTKEIREIYRPIGQLNTRMNEFMIKMDLIGWKVSLRWISTSALQLKEQVV